MVSFGSHDIKLAWGQPHELAETVDHYIVQYKQEKEQTWQMVTFYTCSQQTRGIHPMLFQCLASVSCFFEETV